jgi:hypothetical protein
MHDFELSKLAERKVVQRKRDRRDDHGKGDDAKATMFKKMSGTAPQTL